MNDTGISLRAPLTPLGGIGAHCAVPRCVMEAHSVSCDLPVVVTIYVAESRNDSLALELTMKRNAYRRQGPAYGSDAGIGNAGPVDA